MLRKSLMALLVPVGLSVLGCTEDVAAPIPRSNPSDPTVRHDLVRGNDLRQLIENASNGATIQLSGEYTVDAPIVIQNKQGLTITGSGDGTRIRTTSNFSGLGVLQIGSNVQALRLSRFSIKGTEPDGTNLWGVFTSTPVPTNLSDLTFEHLLIEDMGNGITIGGTPGSCYAVVIFHNRILRMHSRLDTLVDTLRGPVATTSGSGYGIHTQNCQNVWITRNHLEQTARHAVCHFSRA